MVNSFQAAIRIAERNVVESDSSNKMIHAQE